MYDNCKFLLDWIRQYYDKNGERIGYVRVNGQDMQNNAGLFLTTELTANDLRAHFYFIMTKRNVLPMCIYFAVRKVIEHTWINHNDQFLFPNDGWQTDFEFQGDSLTYTLFGDKNRISANPTSNSSLLTPNYFIPFTEQQVGCKKAFKSTFMSDFLRDFLAGKIDVVSTGSTTDAGDLFRDVSPMAQHDGGVAGVSPAEGVAENGSEADGWSEGETSPTQPFCLSSEAQAVYEAGLELWKYYHAQPRANPDASFYDIRKFFQGVSKGRMNNDSADEKYMELIGDLREKQKVLAKRIEQKVYEYGFLR